MNPRYSLRSFARALKLSPALLSLTMGRKRSLSIKTIDKMAPLLHLNPDQVEKLKRQASEYKSRTRLLNSMVVEQEEASTHRSDIYLALSEWYHFAILSLLNLENARLDSRWISKKLGISLSEASLAIQRLQRLKVIRLESGRWIQNLEPVRVGRDVTSLAARKFQKQLLQKAIESLESDPFEKRDITSMVFAKDT